MPIPFLPSFCKFDSLLFSSLLVRSYSALDIVLDGEGENKGRRSIFQLGGRVSSDFITRSGGTEETLLSCSLSKSFGKIRWGWGKQPPLSPECNGCRRSATSLGLLLIISIVMPCSTGGRLFSFAYSRQQEVRLWGVFFKSNLLGNVNTEAFESQQYCVIYKEGLLTWK